MLSFGSIERQARRLLKANKIVSPSVDVRLLARALGATIKEEASDSDVSGALFREEDFVLIGVNSSHSETRKRFTIAHELGHLILHDDPVRIDHHYMEIGQRSRMKPVAQRNQVSSEARDPREIEANRFAAALLMPTDFLEQSLKGLRLPLTGKEIVELSEEYEVSAQAMMFRLINLGVPVDQAGEVES